MARMLERAGSGWASDPAPAKAAGVMVLAAAGVATTALLADWARALDTPIPIAPFIDADIHDGKGEGFRHPDMPPTPGAIEKEEVDPASFGDLPVGRFFKHVLLKTAVGVYYSHPMAGPIFRTWR